MSRAGIRTLVVGLVLAMGLTWILGGPEQAGILAGLHEHPGPGAAAGLVWIVLAPVGCLLVPALLFTAAAEALHAMWARHRAEPLADGLGSRSGPSDTASRDRSSGADRAL